MSSLTGQFSRGIKQRQHFGCFLNRLVGFRNNLSFRVNAIERVCEQLSFEIAIANPVNGQFRRGGVVINFPDDSQADLFCRCNF
jgi:hypothetical protein